MIAGGGNDARAALTTIAGNPSLLGPTVANTAVSFALNVGTIVDELQAAGAKHIIVWNTPNLGLAPAITVAGASALGTFLGTQMNLALTGRLTGEADVSIFDIFDLGTSIAANPSAFGFTDVTDACGAVLNANCNTYAYCDGIHPTAAAHELIADVFVASAIPEASTWAMLIIGFAGIVLMTHRRRKGVVLAA